MAGHPPIDGEDPETTYWRAYVLLLTGDEAAAGVELARLPVDGNWARERAELAAQIDLAEGRPTTSPRFRPPWSHAALGGPSGRAVELAP